MTEENKPTLIDKATVQGVAAIISILLLVGFAYTGYQSSLVSDEAFARWKDLWAIFSGTLLSIMSTYGIVTAMKSNGGD